MSDEGRIERPRRGASEVVARQGIFDVLQVQLRWSDGKEMLASVLALPDWVTVVPVTAEGDLLLIRQARFGADAITVEAPGGVVDEGESPEMAARRELVEETGFAADALRPLGWVFPNPAIQDNRMHFFVAEGARAAGPKQLDEHEDTELLTWSPPRVRRALDDGEVRHALAVIALERALRHLADTR